MRKQMYYWAVALLLGSSAIALKSCDEATDDNTSFDRSALLENAATNIIIPAYTDLKAKTEALATAATAFTASPSVGTLTTVQSAWQDTYTSWQYANAFNFGPAGEEGLRKGLIEEIGTFPISESKMQNAITTGTYNLSDFNRDARGLLAVEYLLFSLTDDNTAILNSFSSATRKTLLTDLIANINIRVGDVLTAWNGSYKQSFIANNGTDVGSSTSQFYNEFVRSFETIKNFKVGLPLGLRPGQTQAEPTKVEAYHSGKSVIMFKAHVQAAENIWYGRKADGTDGIGFEEYLKSVTGGEALITSTLEQLALVKSTMNAVPETRLSTQVQSAPTAATNFHTELQKHTRFFKSDMSSLLGLAITFSSGDGD
jgi:predicted lipoprotein